MSGNEFWAQDMTTVNEKKGWFCKLSPQRRIMFILIAVFVVAWCFFIGMKAAQATQPSPDEWFIVTSDDLHADQMDNVVALEGLHTYLLVGCDEREGYEVGRSDTMMLAFLNGDTNEISLLSIPRDCYVQLPGYSTKTKINHSYSYGGINLTKSTIEHMLGIEIDDYLEIDFDGFVELVDALGGVEINVDQRMINYDEGINLNPGLQTLDGKQALGYCRFRIGQDGTSSISDIKRAEHQQNFIVALKDKLMSLSTVWKIPKMVNLANKYISTSVSTMEALSLGTTLLGMDMSNIKTYTIPTSSMWINSVSYEIVSAPQTRVILSQILGDDFVFTGNIIDDGGAGRYTLGEGEEPAEEEIQLPEGDANGGDANGGDANGGDANGGETNGDNNADNGGSIDDASNIPEPTE